MDAASNRRERWRDRGVAALAGVLLVLAAPPFDLSILAYLTPALLWWVVSAERGSRHPLRRAFGLGWLAGFVAMLGGFYWVVGLLDRFARLPISVCLILLLLLCAWGGVAWGIACAAARLAAPAGWAAILVLPAALAAAERFVPQIFPWPIATTQHGFRHLLQVAEIGGPFAVTFVVACVGVAAAEAARGRRAAALSGGLVFAAALAWGAVRIQSVESMRARAPKRSVALVQPNVSIEDKYDPSKRARILRRLQELSAQAERRGADLVVWPESAHPWRLARGATAEHPMVRRARRGFSADLLFGAVSETRSGGMWNSAYLLTADGRLVGPADKRVLLAFGEYIPLYDQLPFLRSAFPRSGGFTRGDRPEVLDDGRVRIGVMNCYEDVLPEMSLELAEARPHLLVNVTNDAWFGDTSEPLLHAALAVFRSVELRRDLARSVNTGVSSFVDATGRVVEASGTFEERVLVRDVALLEGTTIYATIGDAFAWACLGGVIGAVAVRRLRRLDRSGTGTGTGTPTGAHRA